MTTGGVYICGCARSCGKFLEAVFLNIHNITKLYDDFDIIVAYDISTDNTLDILLQYQRVYGEDKMKIIKNSNAISPIRTENISNARNALLNEIRQSNKPTFTHMIMLDLDDVCAEPMNMDVIKQSMTRTDWDTISFNRTNYYDIWALSLCPYIYSCWHFQPNTFECVDIMKKYVTDKLIKLSPGELLECVSAFNGFAIYKLSAFVNCNYDWILNNNINLMNKLYPGMLNDNSILLGKKMHLGEMYSHNATGTNSDCEHRKFHMSAILLNNARIRISPVSLFLK